MNNWQVRVELELAHASAPGVIALGALARMADRFAGKSVPTTTLHHWIRRCLARRRLQRVQKGLYLNAFRSPPGRPVEAAGHLRRDAVISLQSALAEFGLLNNPPRIMTAVVPLDSDGFLPSLGRVKTAVGEFVFRGIPRRILEAGDAEDRLDLVGHPDFACATAEKALLDWLYLAQSARSTLGAPQSKDIEVDALKRSRLNSLSRSMELSSALRDWQKRAGRG
ncbi:MAG: hypothetical protein WD793_12450 [Steroidobacteraceae bacterium]